MKSKTAYKEITINWGAWNGDTPLTLSLPEKCDTFVARMQDATAQSDSGLLHAFNNPIGSATLQELVKGKHNIAITVEDMTRPSRLERIFNIILNDLEAAGITREEIIIIVATGAHAPMTGLEMENKLGEFVAKNYRIINHNPYDNLSDTGIFLGKTPVKVNRHYYEADFRIAIGSIIPHPFAGFSSGAKLILPGLSDIATLERSHKFVMMGFRGGVNNVENNKFRWELETVVAKIGLDFYVGSVPNSGRDIAGLFVGDFVQAHRAGVRFARQIYLANIPQDNDVVILNAYPKDTELLQADTAFTFFKTIKPKAIQEKGTVVVISKCPNGIGHHGLFGPGMRLNKGPVKHRFLGHCDVVFFSPNIAGAEFKSLYTEEYTLYNQWTGVRSHLQNRFGDQFKVAVLPMAPLQLLNLR